MVREYILRDVAGALPGDGVGDVLLLYNRSANRAISVGVTQGFLEHGCGIVERDRIDANEPPPLLKGSANVRMRFEPENSKYTRSTAQMKVAGRPSEGPMIVVGEKKVSLREIAMRRAKR